MKEVSEKVRHLRTDYIQGELDAASVAADPIQQFGRWMDAAVAAQQIEPNAMTLATVDSDGQPSARIVLLRGFDARGFVFYTNYTSQKGQEIAATGKASLCFFWPDLERQVRIAGRVEQLPAEESDAYFQSRPRQSRIGAWSSPQSQELGDRSELEAQVATHSERFAEGDIPRPDFWGGYVVIPHKIEFWQGRASRLHDRVAYFHDGDDWRITRLAP